MLKWLLNIGHAAECVHIHAAHRLTIEGHDSPGGGSAAVDEGEEFEQDIVDEDGSQDTDDLDNQPRGRRSKQAQAYDELKSEKDRLKADNEKQARELASMQERIAKIEGQHETRESVNTRTNEQLDRAKTRAREVVDEIKKLDRNDPDYSVKVYEKMFEKVIADQAQTAEEISRRTSSEVFDDTRNREKAYADAKEQTLACLEENGLDPDAFELVQALSIMKTQTDPSWFKRVKPEDQIPQLVNLVKERIIKTTRNSQNFKDEKRRHREAMDGTIEEGSRGARGRQREQDDDDRAEGPGSMLADLAKLKRIQGRNTNVMLRQSER